MIRDPVCDMVTEDVTHEMLSERVQTLGRSKARFLQFLERRLGSRADAEDLLQTAFLKLMARGDSLRDEEKLVPWFYQLLRNLMVGHYRHRDATARLEKSVVAETGAATIGVDEELFKAIVPACMMSSLP